VTAERTVVKSGVRALDWRGRSRADQTQDGRMEALLRLFDDIDGSSKARPTPALPRRSMPFLRIGLDDGGRALVLPADPTAEP
jgi:hypothetical protein